MRSVPAKTCFGHALIEDLFTHWMGAVYNDDFPQSGYMQRWADFGPIPPLSSGRPWSYLENLPIMNDVQRRTFHALGDLPDHVQRLVFIVYGEPGQMRDKAEQHDTTIKAMATARRRAIRAVEKAVNDWFASL
jgi:hypothetical protein